ncbi:hypothetical protein ACE1B6_00460 [Aerosakkonemataceae cyanobacterium BLCC-F154]|uniref:Uncharacterized protein n=1 Tax=Floridaenema fluviatile BLCC-F154 TaxID=3153640 RepID=A0ABV4Y5E7_9CYAN
MKLVLIVLEIIILSGFTVSYANHKLQNMGKHYIEQSGFSMLAEAVPEDNGSPDTRGKGKGRGGRFQEDRNKQIKSC